MRTHRSSGIELSLRHRLHAIGRDGPSDLALKVPIAAPLGRRASLRGEEGGKNCDCWRGWGACDIGRLSMQLSHQGVADAGPV